MRTAALDHETIQAIENGAFFNDLSRCSNGEILPIVQELLAQLCIMRAMQIFDEQNPGYMTKFKKNMVRRHHGSLLRVGKRYLNFDKIHCCYRFLLAEAVKNDSVVFRSLKFSSREDRIATLVSYLAKVTDLIGTDYLIYDCDRASTFRKKSDRLGLGYLKISCDEAGKTKILAISKSSAYGEWANGLEPQGEYRDERNLVVQVYDPTNEFWDQPILQQFCIDAISEKLKVNQVNGSSAIDLIKICGPLSAGPAILLESAMERARWFRSEQTLLFKKFLKSRNRTRIKIV